MPACVSKRLHFSSPLKIEDNNIEKQGIVTILGSNCQSSKAAASLRRTLSADTSSKTRLAQNGFHAMKKIASFEQLPEVVPNLHHSSEGEVISKGQDEIWASIQSRKGKEKNELSPSNAWTWGSILTQKQEDSSDLPPPYIHPLEKRSTTSMSEKSLEICTESLGSETGSDIFSSYSPSEIGDQEVKDDGFKINPQPHQQNKYEEVHIVKYHYSCSKKLPPKSFPPPLPSLALQNGASLQMQSHRQNGRLVLEAVSIPTQNYFHAERKDGRLLLTLVDNSSSQEESIGELEDEVQEFDQVFDGINDAVREDELKLDDEDEEGFEEEDEVIEEKDEEFVIEQRTKLPSGVIHVHKAAFMMNNFPGLHNENLTWSPKLVNKAHVKLLGVEEEEVVVVVEDELTPVPQSLPPPPRVARLISTGVSSTATSFNAYEYFWREKPARTSIMKPIPEDCNPTQLKNNPNKVFLASNLKGYGQQNLVLMRGNKGDYLVPFLSKCNEPRRSVLFWEPCCIATS